jgi:hypothetical protein
MVLKLPSGTWRQERKPRYWSANFMGQWPRSYGQARRMKISLPSRSAAPMALCISITKKTTRWAVYYHRYYSSNNISRYLSISPKNRPTMGKLKISPSTHATEELQVLVMAIHRSGPWPKAVCNFLHKLWNKFLNIFRNTNQTGCTNRSVELYRENGSFLWRWG